MNRAIKLIMDCLVLLSFCLFETSSAIDSDVVRVAIYQASHRELLTHIMSTDLITVEDRDCLSERRECTESRSDDLIIDRMQLPLPDRFCFDGVVCDDTLEFSATVRTTSVTMDVFRGDDGRSLELNVMCRSDDQTLIVDGEIMTRRQKMFEFNPTLPVLRHRTEWARRGKSLVISCLTQEIQPPTLTSKPSTLSPGPLLMTSTTPTIEPSVASTQSQCSCIGWIIATVTCIIIIIILLIALIIILSRTRQEKPDLEPTYRPTGGILSISDTPIDLSRLEESEHYHNYNRPQPVGAGEYGEYQEPSEVHGIHRQELTSPTDECKYEALKPQISTISTAYTPIQYDNGNNSYNGEINRNNSEYHEYSIPK